MKKIQIDFTAPGVAQLAEYEIPPLKDDEVLTKTEYSLVSGGTERACLLGSQNTVTGGGNFPISLGYCAIGRVEQTGKSVKSVKKGDRVLVYHGTHATYSVREEREITRVDDDSIPSLDAVFTIIASMGLGGVRKLSLEMGESAMVMGLGLLGIFALQFLKLSGADPLIAADPNPERRKLALALGADAALDPAAPDFEARVMELTENKGVRATVEVTGVSAAMKQALSVASFMGRIALLGCTRVSDTAVDYYREVHKPGVTLIGAHNFVRPQTDSYPGHWTHQDDCRCILRLMARGKLNAEKILSRVVSPKECGKIYDELAGDPRFPMGTVFDWTGFSEAGDGKN